MLKINFSPAIKNLVLIIIRNIFLGMYFLLVAFTAMETIKPRIITNYISLELLMFGLIILGIITAFYYQAAEKEVKNLNFLDHSAIVLLVILIGIFTVYLTRPIGWLAILVGLAASIISYYFTILCYKE